MMSSSTSTANVQAAVSPEQSKSIGYQAPYHQNDSPYQDHYIIAFKPGHSLSKHFVFLGQEIEIEGTLNEGYYAKLDRELFEAVRRDPGVELIEDNTLGEWDDPSEGEVRQEVARVRARKSD